MNLALENKHVFVGGSTRGIGRAIAQAFLAEGARVTITGREPHSLEETQGSFAAEFGADSVAAWRGDLTETPAIDRALAEAVERWGGIDCLVSNVGTGKGKPGWDLEESDWNDLFRKNLWSGVRLVTAALPHMQERPGASVTLISSIAGLESVPAPLPYSAAKTALVGYGKNLARQLGRNGVRVNTVAPGNVLFPGGSWERRLVSNRSEVEKYISSEVPLGRFGTPEEIGAVVAFLASDRASFITGACVVVDGGQTRGMFA